jgi:hypothetical protein
MRKPGGATNTTRASNHSHGKDMIMAGQILTQARLKELLHYDPETGVFTWRVTRNNAVRIGEKAGTDNGLGYLRIYVCGKHYVAHRLAWLYVHGEWPDSELDHANRNKSDNRIQNLRYATRSSNNKNRGVFCNNRSGYTGVSFNKRVGKFAAYAHEDGRQIHIGYYQSAELAAEARAKYVYA